MITNEISYECPSCKKNYFDLDRHYYTHTINCTNTRLNKMQSSIDNERWKRIQLSSENTITINNLKKMFDENTNIIKHQYDKA